MGAWPSPPAYDAYESDDEAALASPYQGTQSHSFHSSEDVDWVRLTVPSFDVARGVSYRIETRNLGWGMDTVLELYDTDGATHLVQNDDGGAEFASQIRWTPTFEGTYYVKVRPYSSQSTAYCDAYYDLLVVANRGVVLPTLMSDYHPFWCDAYEPNDHREVNAWGPLQPGVTYSAKLCRGDAEDNYWFDVSRAGRGYVNLTLPASLVGKTAVAVYAATNPNADIAFSDGPVESAQYRLEYDASHAGRYLVRIYAENAWDDASAYTLRVSVP
ncbi:MAG: hypothetical protein GX601_18460 [Anaerolineales bacterium]|nr:hypothetical protein [Anaerolineales bacterium]